MFINRPSSAASNIYDVVIIGGGATGGGTARDCAMRGLKVMLVERYDFTAGATGRNHGLLHSGARYAVTDGESASECIKENRILRTIARHCVEPTGGLFITLPEDDMAYQAKFIESCRGAGIEANAISPEEAMRIEPAVNPRLVGAVTVPDGAIDPFRLTVANVIDARRHGAQVLTYHEVTRLLRQGTRITGVRLRDAHSGAETDVHANLVINAAGIWGAHIARMADVDIRMFPAKGALLIYGHRVNNVVINRCRKPADADILVPGDTISLIGTTSSHIPYEEIDRMEVTPQEVDILRNEGAMLAPALAHTRILRAYCGVRPLVASDNDPSGRSISRGIVCLDHTVRDGMDGFITITGGKLMTYRLMAEWATDMACKKLGVKAECLTATTPLPGSEPGGQPSQSRRHTLCISTNQKAAEDRHGSMSANIRYDNEEDEALVCECEQVSAGEVKYAINELQVDNLINLRRRTRIGMGTCQGGLCACRASAMLQKAHGCTSRALDDLRGFIRERWKGMYPVAWGESMGEGQLMAWLYGGVCGLNKTTES